MSKVILLTIVFMVTSIVFMVLFSGIGISIIQKDTNYLVYLSILFSLVLVLLIISIVEILKLKDGDKI